MGLLAKPYLQRVSARFGADVDLENYPYNVPSVRALEAIDFHADVTFFIGENGAGKSTVLEAIALALGFNMEGGTKGVQLNTAHQAAPLHQSLKMSRSYKAPRDGYFFRAESFHNVATYMDEIVPHYLDSYGSSSRPIRRSCWPTRMRRFCSSTALASPRWPTRTPSISPSRAIS